MASNELKISIISLSIAMFALIFSIVAHLLNDIKNRKILAYNMLLDINKYVFDYPDAIKDYEGQQISLRDAYASIVWNFLESLLYIVIPTTYSCGMPKHKNGRLFHLEIENFLA